jgi:methionine sulfoxide reductase heme-binding subunit
MTDTAWYVARGTGVIALILLTVVMVLGVGSRSGRPVFGLPRFAVSLVHRNASLIAVGLVTVHVITLLIDPYAQIRLVDVIVPFTAAYRTAWVGFGTIALDLIAVLVLTSLLRPRIGPRTWRTLHWLAYTTWPVAWIHGITTGTDRGSTWYFATAIGTAVIVVAAVIWRCSSGFTTLGGRRIPRRIPETLSRTERPVTTYRGGSR